MKYFIIILSLLFATAVEARGHRITACYEEIDIINYIYYFRSSDIGSLDELFQSKKCIGIFLGRNYQIIPVDQNHSKVVIGNGRTFWIENK